MLTLQNPGLQKKNKMIIKTHLISGAGNTFHIVYDSVQGADVVSLGIDQMKEITRTICDKKAADGFIFLTKKHSGITDNEYVWNFYNKDGSDAEMCGNATRCVGYYIKNILNSNFDKWHLLTVAGDIQIEFIKKDTFKITMTPVQEFKSESGYYCDTGVPHLVIEKSSIDLDDKLKLEARQLRWHPEFQPRGTNVTYVTLEADKAKVKAVSYERGVEDFTAACGTGATAAALFNLTKRGVKQTQVEMPGGTLMMDLSDLNRPTMTGPAVLLGSYKYEISI